MTDLVRTTGAELWVALERAGALTPTSLRLPVETSDEELLAIARMLSGIKRFTSFAMGDLLVHAYNVRGEDFLVEVMEATGMARQTLENTMSICRNVGPSVRREGLSFGHHDVVRKLKPNEQRHWLKVAHENEWTRERLREEIYGRKVLPPAVSQDLPQIVREALSGAREYQDGWWISRDSFVRLRAALEAQEP